MVDYLVQRTNMVESQVRPSDVTDRRILRAMLEIPREEFVPEALKSVAYMDEPVPLSPPANDGVRRYLLAPTLTARLVQLAGVEAKERVLEIGCGTGYTTALLARLAGEVVALESDGRLADLARARLAKLGIRNADVVVGPLRDGALARGPFDIILINGRVGEIPDGCLDQLKDGGCVVAVVGEGAEGRAVRYVRIGRSWSKMPAFSATTPDLPGFERARAFAL
jgi:protein-L-isoaspartate(D-aspartate) O-methyltransferase